MKLGIVSSNPNGAASSVVVAERVVDEAGVLEVFPPSPLVGNNQSKNSLFRVRRRAGTQGDV